jgi:hypothetical protein
MLKGLGSSNPLLSAIESFSVCNSTTDEIQGSIMREIATYRFTFPIAMVFCACQLASCAVLPERLSGFKEPSEIQQTNIEEAKAYAEKVNGELLDLHDQYVLLEDALIAGALGSGVDYCRPG